MLVMMVEEVLMIGNSDDDGFSGVPPAGLQSSTGVAANRKSGEQYFKLQIPCVFCKVYISYPLTFSH